MIKDQEVYIICENDPYKFSTKKLAWHLLCGSWNPSFIDGKECHVLASQEQWYCSEPGRGELDGSWLQ